MGRPPIGKVAMTGSERVKRYRLKHRQDKRVTKPASPVTKPSADGWFLNVIAQLEERVIWLEAQLADRNAELARERNRREAAEAKHPHPNGDDDGRIRRLPQTDAPPQPPPVERRRKRATALSAGSTANKFIRELLECMTTFVRDMENCDPRELSSDDREAIVRTLYDCADEYMLVAQTLNQQGEDGREPGPPAATKVIDP